MPSFAAVLHRHERADGTHGGRGILAHVLRTSRGRDLSQPLLIHVHTIVFVGWLALFLTPVVLAAAGQVKWHLRLGRFGIGYGAMVVAVGLVTGISRSADRVRTGRSPNALLLDVVMAMALFSIFFGAAIVFRRTPRLHRRLMTAAPPCCSWLRRVA